jgi:hypothetical protein
MRRSVLAACLGACLGAFLSKPAAAAFVVTIEDAGFASSGNVIQDVLPGFGSFGGGASGLTFDWNPDDDPGKALLNGVGDYSGRAAAYCATGTGCALTITAGPLAFIMLESFFLGSRQDADREIAYAVIDLADGSVVASGTPTVGGAGLVVTVNALSDDGFRIEFGPDGVNGGINDIAFQPGVIDPPFDVPAPGALALFGLGLAGLGLIRRRA